MAKGRSLNFLYFFSEDIDNMEWSEHLSIGIGEIDDQHKALLERITTLKRKIDEKDHEDGLRESIHFLKKFVLDHFIEEEELMQEHSYPDFELHKAYHEGFIKHLEKIEGQILDQGYTESLANEVYGWLICWFCDHVARDDKSIETHVAASLASK